MLHFKRIAILEAKFVEIGASVTLSACFCLFIKILQKNSCMIFHSTKDLSTIYF